VHTQAADEARLATAIDNALGQPTLCTAFQVTAVANGDRVALRQSGNNKALSYRNMADRVHAVAGGLTALGLGAGTRWV
jgi:non-ribosomal peptide synthetase component E (peptide arylation enzyme)